MVRFWLNSILYLTGKIHWYKEEMLNAGVLRTLRLALSIFAFEVTVLIVALPTYFFVTLKKEKLGTESNSMDMYRVRKRFTLTGLGFFAIFLSVYFIITGGVLLSNPQHIQAISSGWSFSHPEKYLYDSRKIQITDGVALLKAVSKEEHTPVLNSSESKIPTSVEVDNQGTSSSIKTEDEKTETDQEKGIEVIPVIESQLEPEVIKEELEPAPVSFLRSVFANVVYAQEEVTREVCSASIQPIESLHVTGLKEWTGFVEVADKQGGEIRYQLSDDDGSTWKYWNDGKWQQASSDDLNTADVIDKHIKDFSTETGRILFAAVLTSNCESLVHMIELSITYDVVGIDGGRADYRLTDSDKAVSFTDTEGNPITQTAGRAFIRFDNKLVGFLEIEKDFDTSGYEMGHADGTSWIHLGETDRSGITTIQLIVPKLPDQDSVRVCPGAASSNTVFEGCEGEIILHVESPSQGGYTLVDIEDQEYWYVQSDNVATFSTGAQGTITGPLDSDTFDSTQGKEPKVIQISGSVYAVVYKGSGNDGFLRTFSVNSNGDVTSTNIDTLEFDTTNGKTPSILSISGDIYAIAYTGTGDDGFIKTVDIDSSGNIENSVIDTLEFDTVKGKTPYVLNISGDIYVIAYAGNGDDGFIKTIEINSSGAITNSIIDTLEFDTVKGKTPYILSISGDIYAVAYAGNGDDGFIKTIDIDSSGNIENSVIDTLEFDTTKGKTPELINISGDIYAVAYTGDGDDGFIKTVDIDSSGNIENSIIDTLEFDTDVGKTPNIIAIVGNVYALAYQGSNEEIYVKTFQIEDDGSIDNTVVDTFVATSDTSSTPRIIRIVGDTYLIAYTDNDDDDKGKFITLDIDSVPAGITLTAPNGGDTLTLLATTTITWTSAITSGNVKIEYSKDGFSSDINTIVSSTTDDGSYAWLVPNDATRSATVRISDAENATLNDISDANNTLQGDIAGWTELQGLFTVTGASNLETAFASYDTILPNGSRFVFPHLESGILGIASSSATSTVPNVSDFGDASNWNNRFTLSSTTLDSNFPLVGFTDISGGAVTSWNSSVEFKLEYRSDNYLYLLVDDVDYLKSSATFSGDITLYFAVPDAYTVDADFPVFTVQSLDSFALTDSDPDITFTNSSGDLISSTDSDAYIRHDNIIVGYVELSDDLDTGDYTIGQSSGASWIHMGLNDRSAITKIQLIVSKIGSHDFVRICPEASSAGEVTDGCDDEIHLSENSPEAEGYTLVTLSDNDYWYIEADDVNVFSTGSQGVISSLGSTETFDAVAGKDPDIIHISGDIFAIAYQGVGSDGFIKTIEVDSSGTFVSTSTDSFEYDTSKGVGPDIINISGNVYAIAYQGNGNDGFIKTITIDTSGNITASAIDTLEFDTIQGKNVSFINISGDVYAVAYKGADNDGFIKTVEIDTSGNITNTIIDTLEFDTGDTKFPELINISGNVYAVAYQSTGNDGFVKTITIDTSGNITNTIIDTLEFDASSGKEPQIRRVSGNVYMFVYGGVGDDGFVKTITIDTSGNITATAIDTLEYDTSRGRQPFVIPIVGDIFASIYQGNGNDGFIKTFDIDSSGAIENSVVATLEFDTLFAAFPKIINISGDKYLVAYEGSGAVGILNTVDINSTPTSVTVTAPNGAESLTGSATTTITWTSANTSGNVKIEYSKDGFVLDTNVITATTADDGSYIWTIPNDPSTTVTVRISDAANLVYSDESDANFTILATPNITVTAPNGAESLTGSATTTITWTSANTSGNVKIEYSKDGFVLDTNVITATTADDGSYIWTIPNDPSTTVTVRISDVSTPSLLDVSNANFTILATPIITVVYPNGSEKPTVASIATVRWTSETTSGNVKIEYSKDGFVLDTNVVTSSTSDDGSYAWTIPDDPSTTVTVRISDVATPSLLDVSDANFTILTPDTNPISRWALDDNTGCTATDSYDSNNGTLSPNCASNSPTWTTGKENSALSFDGSDDYVTVANASNLNPETAVTVSAWIKWDIDPTTGNARAQILSKNGDDQYQLQHNSGNTAFEFAVNTSSGRQVIVGTTTPAQNTWYFVAGTYDGQILKLYVNGGLDSSTSGDGDILSSTGAFDIGRRSVDTDRYFDGIIDEVSMWNRALSASEINSLYLIGNNEEPSLTLSSISQQTDDGRVNVVYSLSDAESDFISLPVYEYSLTGVFGGEQATATPATLDGAHDGITGLSSSPGGVSHTFVWNAAADLSNVYDTTVFVRFAPSDGIESGSISTSSAFTVDIKNPIVSNVSASQSSSSTDIVITYDLADDTSTGLTVEIDISEDGGGTWSVTDTSVTGNVGASQMTGTGKSITWDAGTDFSGQSQSDIRVRVRATDTFTNQGAYTESSNFAVDTASPVVSNVSATQTGGTDNIVITYDLADDTSTGLTVEIDISEDGGGTWSVTDTSVTGNVGASQMTGTGKSITWDAGTDFSGQSQSDIRVRVRATDTFTNQGAYTESSNFAVDTKNPSTNVTVDVQSQPNAGDTSIVLGGSFIETNPNTNSFFVAINNGAYGSATSGTSNTASPANQATAVGATLDGNDVVTKAKIVHEDDYSHSFINENTSLSSSLSYVKPYTPATPTVGSPTISTVNIVVNKHSSEIAGLKYAIFESSTGFYVQTNGTLSTSTVWQTISTWGTKTVTGLSDPVSQYTFSTKSRNSSDLSNATSSESSLSSGASVDNSAPAISITSAVQTTDGSKYVTISYVGTDVDNDTVSLITVEYSTDNLVWQAMTEKTGVGSDGTSGLAFTASGTSLEFMWDIGADLGAIEDSTVYVRLQGNDSALDGSVTVSSAFVIDTKPTVISNLAVTQTLNSSNVVITYDLADALSLLATIEMDISEDSGATWNVASTTLSGDVGTGVSIGNSSVTWNAGTDFDDQYQTDMRFRIRATDAHSNVSSYVESSDFTLDTVIPVVSTIVAVQNTGLNTVAITYNLSDDTATNLNTELEISEDSGATWNIATSTLTGALGTGQSTGSGKTIEWNAGVDFDEEDQSDLRIRIRATDAYQNSSSFATSSDFALDTRAPFGMVGFSGASASTTSIVWTWTPVAVESNFARYEVWFGENLTDVQNRVGTATQWSTTEDVDLATVGTASTNVTGLSEGITYYAKIFAIDNFANEATLTAAQFDTESSIDSQPSTPSGGGGGGILSFAAPLIPILDQPLTPQLPGLIVISGTAEPSSIIDIYNNNQKIENLLIVTNSNGSFTTLITLNEGVHVLRAIAVRPLGSFQSDLSLPRTLVIQTQIPEVVSPGDLGGGLLEGIESTQEATLPRLVEIIQRAEESPILATPIIMNVSSVEIGNTISFTGTGIPNSDLVLFVHSEQAFVSQTHVAQDGTWKFIHDQDILTLAPGDHTIFALTLDEKSNIKSVASPITSFVVSVNYPALIISKLDIMTTLLTISIIIIGIYIFILRRRQLQDILS